MKKEQQKRKAESLEVCQCGCGKLFFTTNPEKVKYLQGHGGRLPYVPRKVENHRVCQCGCQEIFVASNPCHRYKRGHSPHQFYKRKTPKSSWTPATPPAPDRPDACGKCGNEALQLEEYLNLDDQGPMVETYWHCIVCGWILFVRPGIRELKQEAV